MRLRKACDVEKFVAKPWRRVAVVLSFASVLGCTAGGREGAFLGGTEGLGGAAGQGSALTGMDCEAGSVRECGITLEQEGDIVTCYQGTQTCGDDLRWGDCGSGEVIKKPVPSAESFKAGLVRRFAIDTLSTVAAVTCNPTDQCDPYCYEVAEGAATWTLATPDPGAKLCDPADATPPAECSSAPGCAHSLCTTGSALSTAYCGSCSVAVCNAKATCCSTTWDSSCVDLAHSLCNNSPPPLGLCDFGVFSLTTLNTSNAPSFGSLTMLGAVSDVIIDTDAANAFPTTVVSKGDIWIKNANQTSVSASGGIWAQGGVIIDAGSTTAWTTDVHAGTGFYMNSGNTVTGSVYTSANYSVSFSPGFPTPTTATFNAQGQDSSTQVTNLYAAGTAATYPTVTGTKTTGLGTSGSSTPRGVQVPSIDIPSALPTSGATCSGATAFPATANTSISGTTPNQLATTSDGVLTLAPGNYGTLTLQNSAKVVLSSAGNYTFKSINGTGNAGGIQLGTATGSYKVTVCGKLVLGNNMNIIQNTASTTNSNVGAAVSTPVVTDPTMLTLYALDNDSSGTPAAKFSLGNKFTGVLVVPNGTFDAGNNVVFNGAVWANKFNVGTGFSFTQMSKSSCQSLAITGTGPSSTCDADLDAGSITTIPPVQAASVSPCRSGADCQQNQRCTNVETRSGSTTCLKDKCDASIGTGITSASCMPSDPCVAAIFAASPGCTTNWNSTCVNLIPSLCDATCGGGTRTGTCVSNAGQAAEPGCTGYDLALGYACTPTTIPVCNHGSTQFSGAVSVGYWALSKRKFASTAPGLPDGSCSATLTIPAGSCTNLTCSALTAGSSYSLMVDPPTASYANGVLSECGSASNVGRRQDNWSWIDGTYTCTVNPDVANYEYVADCPDGSTALWKFLKWVTDNNTGTQVVFKGRVADRLDSDPPPAPPAEGSDETVLSDLPWTTLGTNTTDCTMANADSLQPQCSALLTTALGLTAPQGQVFGLRVERTGNATVSTWEVSYTCRADE
jgi:hypothetical protein